MENPFEVILAKLNRIEEAINQIPTPEALPPMEILNGEQLAEKLNITVQTLHKWRGKKKVPFLQIGSAIRYDLYKVLKALEKK